MLSEKRGGKMAKILSIIGLLVALAGVLVLFRYGMPYRVETRGQSRLILEGTDHDEIALDVRYRKIGHLGLALAVLGTLLQIAGAAIA